MFRKPDTVGRQGVDVGARLAVVAVCAQTIGTQGVDRNEEHINVTTRREGRDIVAVAKGPRVRADFQLQSHRPQHEDRRGDDVKPFCC